MRACRTLIATSFGDHAKVEQLVDLLRPYPAELMCAYPVGQRVGSVRNNDPALLDPMTLAA